MSSADLPVSYSLSAFKICASVNFDVIFIDIDLSSKSELDGYSLIQQLQNLDANINKKIVILTGNNKIIESLNLRNLNSINILIIIKPTDYEEITNMINRVKKAKE